MTTPWPNHALQRTRPSRSGCNRAPSRAGSFYVSHEKNGDPTAKEGEESDLSDDQFFQF